MDKRESPACLECSSLIKKVWKPKKMRKYDSGYEKNKYDDDIQVNICQKHLFLHQLTHIMYMKIPSSDHVVYINCSECQNKNTKQFVYNMF